MLELLILLDYKLILLFPPSSICFSQSRNKTCTFYLLGVFFI